MWGTRMRHTTWWLEYSAVLTVSHKPFSDQTPGRKGPRVHPRTSNHYQIGLWSLTLLASQPHLKICKLHKNHVIVTSLTPMHQLCYLICQSFLCYAKVRSNLTQTVSVKNFHETTMCWPDDGPSTSWSGLQVSAWKVWANFRLGHL